MRLLKSPKPKVQGVRHLDVQAAAERARRARRKLLALAPILAAVLVAYRWRVELFGVDEPIRIATAIVLVIIGWAFARQLGGALRPKLERLDPNVAGVAGFFIRLVTVLVMLIVSLRVAGLELGTLALGASFTAVVLGLAAQQTIGNLLAGIVLLSARPFTVGDRVRFVGAGIEVEGTVEQQGLLYVSVRDGADVVMIPNATTLTISIRPIREPAGVDLRARLPQDVDPTEVEERVTEGISVPVRSDPHVELEEFDGVEVVVRIRATPSDPQQGGALAREVLRAVAEMTPADRDGRIRTGGLRVPNAAL